MQLRIIETADIHSRILDYDDYADKTDSSIGLNRAATLIKNLRQEVSNSVMIDNGDLIQGNCLADFIHKKGLTNDIHPVYKAMNYIQYDIGNIGNHEFNYGLDYLKSCISGAHFPYVCANIYDIETNECVFSPYVLKTYQFFTDNYRPTQLTVGFIGFVPPKVMLWDKVNLEDKVYAEDIYLSALKYIPIMKEQGAEVIIAIPHSGLSTKDYEQFAENSVYYLSFIKEVDAIAFGHTHKVFPSKDFKDLPGVDIRQGRINGIPSVMPGRFGNHVGVIDLQLAQHNGHWYVKQGFGHAAPIYNWRKNKPLVQPDLHINEMVAKDYQETRAHYKKEIGFTQTGIFGYLSLIQNDMTIQLVNDALYDFGQFIIEGDPELDNEKLLIANPYTFSPQKIEIPQNSAMSLKDINNILKYNNTITLLKVTGKEVKEWLECAASLFNTVRHNTDKPTELLNNTYRNYNFDVISQLKYDIDIGQPPRYNSDYKLTNHRTHRISNVTYQDKPVDDTQEFLVLTNSHRALSSHFPGCEEKNIILNNATTIRDIVESYIIKKTYKEEYINDNTQYNWRFKPISSYKKVSIVFQSLCHPQALQYIQTKSKYPITLLSKNEHSQWGTFQLNL